MPMLADVLVSVPPCVRHRATRAMMTVVLLCAGLGMPSMLQAQARCTHYAAPTGRGNGASPGTPFTLAAFWSVAAPGDTVCLLDGRYTGASSMIDPPNHFRGAPGRPITVRALQDGKVLIDGEGQRQPLVLAQNHWIHVEGVNACCSSGGVVQITQGSTNTQIRRVAAWDAADLNVDVVGVHHASHHLLEDVAAWGVGRKTFANAQWGNDVTLRRTWGRWDGSHETGPKMVYSLIYNNYRNLFENVLGTWGGGNMRETYRLQCDAQPRNADNSCGKTFTHGEVFFPYGIFSGNNMYPQFEHTTNSKILGGIAYVREGDRMDAPRLVDYGLQNGITLVDIVAVTGRPGKEMIALRRPRQSGGPNTATNLTGIGGTTNIIEEGWRTRNIRALAAPPPNGAIFTETPGICKRSVNGRLTNDPLWPWPMNQRIQEGMVQSGRPPVDVQADIERLLGPIPAPCTGAAPLPASQADAPLLVKGARPASERETVSVSAPQDRDARRPQTDVDADASALLGPPQVIAPAPLNLRPLNDRHP